MKKTSIPDGKFFILMIFFLAFSGLVFGQIVDSSGTGFFITDNGIIITCAHVIENSSRITVRINNQEFEAEILGENSEIDLAVLKINYRNPYHFRIGDFNAVSLGDRLSVLGYPLPGILSSDIRFTEGSLSARSGLKSDIYFFQHSAPTQPGNSGGPILNSRFEVIGVAAAIINDTIVKRDTGTNPQNINFGIKSGYISPLLGNTRPGNGNVNSINDAEKATVQILCYFSRQQNRTAITVVNSTGYTGWYLYISPNSDENWGPDRLGSDVLLSGRSVTLQDIPASANNRYDLRLVDSDDDSYTRWNVQILPNQTVEFTFSDIDSGSRETLISYNGPPVTIVNNTGYTVYFLYISPATSDSWGEDRLASDQVLYSGQTVSVNLPQPLSVTNKYDIMLEDSDGDTYSKYNVTVTANGRIVFNFSDID